MGLQVPMMNTLFNVRVFLTDGDSIVPGSIRDGHNSITNYGKLWLSRLVAWSTIRDIGTEPTLDDVVLSSLRVRWVGVGTGFQPESKHVSHLQTPTAVNGTPDYLKLSSVVPAGSTDRRVRTAVMFTCTFSKPELPSSPAVAEIGLFADANDTGGVYGPVVTAIPATTQYAEPIAYRNIDPPLTKTVGVHNLVVQWELRF